MILLDKKEIKFDTFPNGDIYLKTNLNELFANNFEYIVKNGFYNLYVKLRSSDDIMKLSIFMNAFNNYCQYSHKNVDNVYKIICHLLYCPYMQADKYIPEQTCSISLDIIANIINMCNFHKVYVYGAHSIKVKDKINNCTLLYPIFPVDKITTDKSFYVCAPDKGALHRAGRFMNNASYNGNFIQCEKTRDLTTGKLTTFKLLNKGVDLRERDIIIYDDVSVNGGTFSGVAKLLKEEHGAKNVYLCVTHVINLNYIEYIDKVYYLNLFPSKNNTGPLIGSQREEYIKKVKNQYISYSFQNVNYFKL